MSRFVIVSFAVMGWAFYELSGGADFVPETRAEPVFAPVVARDASVPGDLVPDISTKSVSGSDEVLAAAQSPDALVQPIKAALLTADIEPAARDAALTSLQAAAGAPVARVGYTDGSEAQVQTISVTLEPASPAPVTAAPAWRDMRQVTGSRVNMRAGPGTGFSVIAQVLAGTEVEVLSDIGDGWLELRVEDTGEVGYMADWLVTAAAE